MDKSDYILRKAMMTDLPAIMVIEQLCFADDCFSEQQFAYLIRHAKGWFYVITHREQIVGYASLLSNARTHYLRIYSIAIHPEFKGKGLGQMMMEQIIRTAKNNNMEKITLEVNVFNKTAIILYKRNGFISRSIKKNYYHNGTDALYMQRDCKQ